MRVLWLRPTTGENISVGRNRIAEHLERRGVSVEIKDSTGRDAVSAAWAALSGNYDVIVGTARAGLYLGYPLALLSRSGFVADIADPIEQITDLPDPVFRFFNWYELQVLKRTPRRAVVYESTRRRLASEGLTSTSVENGVDFHRFATPDDDVIQRAKSILLDAGVNLDMPIAIYVGGLSSDATTFSPESFQLIEKG